ncbi:hypothetical protein [Granulicella arctica]|uniref:Uncharacterized protein n=1 Tax=Granulicella arctica TaxID=940613 RepID=A0A7Y9TSF0_9BACT|nr:hypothetical protein [Granulicella arctica]NYF78943.1 hypothetical protein [Granulicella arctica]
MISQNITRCTIAAIFSLALLTGCKSKQDTAIEQAKQQAAATGQPQQVVSVDKNGTTTTTTIQPPVPGQAGQAISTTVTPANSPAPAPNPSDNTQPAPNQAMQGSQTAPAPGAAPIIRPADVHVAAGTPLAIRINQHISVKTSRAGDRFTGEVVEPITGTNNQVVIPKGTNVEGIVEASHRRGHFRGRSILELRLTSLYLNGTRYPIDTNDLTRTKKGKGKRSAAFIGGGTGLGMLVGGVATGGVGLVVGGLAGAGAGTAIGGLTGNRDIEIPSESIVRFRLADDLVLRQ